MIRFACPKCGAIYSVAERHGGKVKPCQRCTTPMLIPGSPSPAAEQPTSPEVAPRRSRWRLFLFLALFLLLLGCIAGAPLGFYVGRWTQQANGEGNPAEKPVSDKQTADRDSAFSGPPIPGHTLNWMRSQMQLIKEIMASGRAGPGEENLLAQYQGELQSAPELPYIRRAARKLFNTADFTEGTVDQIQDWLCTDYKLTPQQAGEMNLRDVAAKLKAAK